MKVFVSVAERSASNYLYNIFKGVEGIDFWGITDERLESIGFRSFGKLEDFSVIGIWEALPKIPKVLKFYRDFERYINEFDILIVCDAPALNIPLLKRAKGKVKKIIYFISPQVWAWKEERAEVIARYVDHLIVLFSFEVEFYKKYAKENFHVHFVGHPLVDLAKPSLGEKDFKDFLGMDSYIAILPGSRWSEIKRHVGYVKEAYKKLWKEFKLPAVIPTFDTFKAFIEQNTKDLPIKVITPKDITTPSYNTMAYAEISLVASGTADLEASLLGSPHVTYYRVNPLTYWIGRKLVKVPYVSLTNLILGKRAIPEVIQLSDKELYEESKKILIDARIRECMLQDFNQLRSSLGKERVLDKLRGLFLEIILH